MDAIYDEICTAPVDDSLDMTEYRFVPLLRLFLRSGRGESGAGAGQARGNRLRSHDVRGAGNSGDAVYFRDVLGSCETKHSDNENRNTNLRLLCEALNGVVVQPGETFSYNDTLGERTAEKGATSPPPPTRQPPDRRHRRRRVRAPAHCTTAYCFADLEVVTRSCHGATVAYLPLGLDAAVNWGTTDYQFRNNFHFPVKIEAETTVDLVKMRILGTDEKDYYIEMTSGYDDSREDVIYAVSYKNKYSKEKPAS